MSEEPLLEISDLVAQYVLHPEFRDFFVEGRQDKSFYQWFLNRMTSVSEPHCYEIACVNITSTVLKKYKLSANCERDKVVALALELAKELPKNSREVTCIAEADFIYLFNNLIGCKLLLYTDYTCLEMYTLTRDVLEKFLAATGGFPIAADRIIEEICPILVDLFLVRATNFDLNLGMEWLPIKGRRYRVDRDGKVHFDIKGFVRAYLEKNNMTCEEEEFWRRFKQLKKSVSGDIRKFIRGHDYVEMLAHYLYQVVNRLKQWKENPVNLSGALLGCLEENQLCKEPLFAAMVSRVN